MAKKRTTTRLYPEIVKQVEVFLREYAKRDNPGVPMVAGWVYRKPLLEYLLTIWKHDEWGAVSTLSSIQGYFCDHFEHYNDWETLEWTKGPGKTGKIYYRIRPQTKEMKEAKVRLLFMSCPLCPCPLCACLLMYMSLM
jgi:hypothetical protein